MNADKGIKLQDGRAICENCGQWQYTGTRKLGKIIHSRRCDTPEAQSVANEINIPNLAGKYSKESPGSGLTSDELRDAVHRGQLTQSDAMNTDF